MAYALRAPIVGMDSLALVARNAPPDARRISVIGDAQRGELYAADFGRVANGSTLVRRTPTRVISVDAWAAELPDDAFVLGPACGVPRLAATLPAHIPRALDPAFHQPDPRHLAAYARELWREGRHEDLFFLEPIYLRRSAAEDQWDRRPPAP